MLRPEDLVGLFQSLLPLAVGCQIRQTEPQFILKMFLARFNPLHDCLRDLSPQFCQALLRVFRLHLSGHVAEDRASMFCKRVLERDNEGLMWITPARR